MKVLLLGATGVLGTKLTELLSKNFTLFPCGFNNKTKYNFNILEKNKFKKIINKLNPNVIINCIGNRNVDKCNKDFFYGYNLNVKVCEIIAKSVEKRKIHLIHFSSDQVYNNKISKNKVIQKVEPVGYYGLTKLIGEKIIQSHKNHTIIRTNFFNFNFNKEKSYSEWIYENLKSKNNIFAATNIKYNPISTELLSKIVYKDYKKKKLWKFDLGSNKILSKYQFAKSIADKFCLIVN